MKYTTIALAAGFLIDLAAGDPRWLYHPVILIGKLISVLEHTIRSMFPETDQGEFLGGILEVLLVCAASFLIPFGILRILYRICTPAGLILETFWCWQLFACRSLKTESMKVYDKLTNGTLEEARTAVSMIVGRDTAALDETGVTKAAVETVAENTSDGIIAPMFYMAIGGAPLMFLYKGINTMDSMLGYKNDQYLYFGRCAAHLDDVVNYIPSVCRDF
jgi:adenosylcobinamide-phosphate synthase